jgi:hypothetical protein
MGRVRSWTLVAVAAVLGALIAAPGASARDVHVHVNIKDQNGYRMSIEASRSVRRSIQIASGKISGPNAPAPFRAVSRQHAAQVAQRAKASASRPRASSGFLSVQVQNHHSIATYNVQGTVTHNRLFAKLGDLGRISLHFHLRHARTNRHGCFREHERLGVFRGHVRFRGEDDYVNVDARELRGKVETRGGRTHRCRRIVIAVPSGPDKKAESTAKPASERDRAERYTLFYARRHLAFGRTYFAAIKETREFTVFFAANFQRRGEVFIDREEYSEGKAGDFHTAKGLKAARIEPSPHAYRGTGHFRAHNHRGHNRWKGSLATSFPGAAHIGLAGANFKAELRRFDLFY